MEHAPLQDLGKMTRESRGTLDAVTDVPSNKIAARWYGNKIVNSLPAFTGKEQIEPVKIFFKKQGKRVDTEHQKMINIYNKSKREVDRMDKWTRILQHIWSTYDQRSGGGPSLNLC